ncbi:MAG: urease accessory protein [Candidatus Nitrosomirales archaeon]|jgi:urease accessory protein
MITITSVVGNIRSDKKFGDAYTKLEGEKKVERVLLSRMEAQRSRMRKVSDAGTDIAINIENGSVLKHGDILLANESKLIVVEYEQEDVLGFKIRDELSSDQKTIVAIKLGHIIGNLHRPICTKDSITYIPIQSESEVVNIKNNLAPIIDYIDIRHTKMVFEPEGGVEHHTH